MITPLQTSFIGYDDPCTVLGAYDDDKELFSIAKIVKPIPDRYKTCTLITNNKKHDYDFLFSDDDINKAIRSFFMMKDKVSFNQGAERANPTNNIEKDGIDSHGETYRVRRLSCANVSVIAMCLYIEQLFNINNSLDMFEKINDINRINNGEIFTI